MRPFCYYASNHLLMVWRKSVTILILYGSIWALELFSYHPCLVLHFTVIYCCQQLNWCTRWNNGRHNDMISSSATNCDYLGMHDDHSRGREWLDIGLKLLGRRCHKSCCGCLDIYRCVLSYAVGKQYFLYYIIGRLPQCWKIEEIIPSGCNTSNDTLRGTCLSHVKTLLDYIRL